ncbi:unnamed protein product [Adineta ricciae]|uniref:DNA/RNA-binding protein Alba-like domain-containing protein n=2 Tax=Adineta ricciae TaxID=249248 RepID=A0A814PB23_ADIRI|nr:unnamed protein product [Adineta ricciae]
MSNEQHSLKESLPLPYILHSSCLHMQVKAADNSIEQITWNATGDGISKAIACAEMLKRESNLTFHEYVQIGYKAKDEKISITKKIKLNKDIPSICVLLSKIKTKMSSIAFIFNIIFSLIITLIFLYRCGNYRRQHVVTTIAVFIAWFFSTLTIFILPLDISLAIYRDCVTHPEPITVKPPTSNNSLINNSTVIVCPRPWSYVDRNVYAVLWQVVFWTSQVLTWLILPLMQSFRETGEFSIKGKIRYAIKANLIFYGTLLLIFIVLVIYVATKVTMDSSSFTATLVAASTTWGLFLLVLMLGYGLVQVPKNIYNHSRTSYMLAHTQFKLSRLYNEKVDVEERLDSLIDDVIKFCMQIKTTDPLRPCLEQIIQIVPEQYSNRIQLTLNDYANNLSWTRQINEAFYFEDIVKNAENTNHEFVRTNPSSATWLRRKLFDKHPKLEWYTHCFLRPWGLRLLGIGLGIISLLVIWSEMTFFSTSPVLSIFAQCVTAASRHYSYLTIEIFCCLSIAYLCLCAYYTIFRIRILNYFYLSLYHLTDENSLIFAATFLCRLTAPLCYNFLGMIHLDQAITHKIDHEETAFTSIMGHLTAIKIVSVGFNFYFPMLICLLSFGTFFRLGSRCLHACGFRQFFDDDDVSTEYVEDGKSLMARERRNYGGVDTLANTTTATQRRDRRRELEEKYGLRSARAMAANNLYSDDPMISETRPLISNTDDPLIDTQPEPSVRPDSSDPADLSSTIIIDA